MTVLTPRIGLVVLARPQFDTAFAQETVDRAWRQLQGLEAEFIGTPDLLFDADAVKGRVADLTRRPLDLLLVLQATFTDAVMTVALADSVDAPLFLWSFPEPRTGGRLRLNAICGVNLAAHALGRAGRPYDYVNGDADDPAALAEIEATARAGAIRRKLAETRIGVVGQHPAGFDSCRYDPAGLQSLLGVSVEPIDLSAFFERARSVADGDIRAIRDRVASEISGLDGLDQDALAKSLRVYAALRRTADDGKFAGLAVRCWPEFFTELGGAACGPMGMMGEDGTPCGCEADVLGTISTLILRWLSDAPAFNSDLVDVDVTDDTAVFWHCGQAPVSMADPDGPRRATVHSNRRLPLLYEFAFKPGRITLARLSQSKNQLRLVVGGGEVLKRPLSFSGTSGVVRFDRPAREVMDAVIGEGLEHHMSLAYGDHRPALRRLARMLDIPALELT
ncbi:MAG: L-fucose/L-arabinose isomerase family protein [Rhodospirillales bacterium]|nr:L-fucose/L-arabinose isomerase family protein [Rhodospirillales bacterium]